MFRNCYGAGLTNCVYENEWVIWYIVCLVVISMYGLHGESLVFRNCHGADLTN